MENLPVKIGTRTISVNFIVANLTEEKAEAILGHAFL